MPPRLPIGQPAGLSDNPGIWFESAPGQAVLESESDSIRAALAQRPGQSWLWLAPTSAPSDAPGRGLQLQACAPGWRGPVRCALPLPLANESIATVVIQHTARGGMGRSALIEECARVLVPGGRLWLYALNPLSPYRWRWSGSGLSASEPLPWRRRMRQAGLAPESVSQGIGPCWRIQTRADLQPGPGLRAAYLLRAEKRVLPLTPLRPRPALRIGEGVQAA